MVGRQILVIFHLIVKKWIGVTTFIFIIYLNVSSCRELGQAIAHNQRINRQNSQCILKTFYQQSSQGWLPVISKFFSLYSWSKMLLCLNWKMKVIFKIVWNYVQHYKKTTLLILWKFHILASIFNFAVIHLWYLIILGNRLDLIFSVSHVN